MADILLGLVVIGGIVIGGIVVLFRMVDQRFPPIFINVWDRGLFIPNVKYRLAGDTIVTDNAFRLLLNDFTICGDKNDLEFDRTTKNTRVYKAYLMHDYLFGMKHEKEGITKDADGSDKVVLMQNQVPYIECDKGLKVSYNKDGLLVPYKRVFAPQYMTEQQVNSGKAICVRFIESQKQNKNYNEATNPFINTLLYSLPLLLVVIGIGVMLYLILNGVSSDMVQLAGISNANMQLTQQVLNQTAILIDKLGR
jgi:hypothetical protein